MMDPAPASPVNAKSIQDSVSQTQPTKTNGVSLERDPLRQSIDRGWAVAAAEFKRLTKRDLGDYNGGKEGVLGSLRSAYDEDNEKSKKHDALWSVVEKVLRGVEWVGSLASSIGGLFFPPAGACFCAIEALINIPRLLKKLSDDLRRLFDRIMSFFSTLRILRRADAQLGLDGELVRKTNEILMCLVKVCAIAIHARDHKISALTSTLFLGDDKMEAALEEFKTLCDDQNKLVTTVTLEEAMQTRSIAKDINGRTIVIEGQTREANEGIKDLRADNAYRKNREATQDMVSRIQKEWRIRESDMTGPLQELGPCLTELLPGTFEALASNDQYSAWSDKEHQRKSLYLSGDAGTGRTFFLAALARHIEEGKKTLVDGDPSVYLVYYAFSGVDEANSDEDKSKDTALLTALRNMACRLAQQSTTYAKRLSEQYRSLNDKSLEDLWKHLRFEDFDAPAKSILYLCFDGLDRLKDPKPLARLLDSIATSDKMSTSTDKLRLRIILTGKDDTLSNRASIPVINVKDLNKPILKQYVQNSMQNIVDPQDHDTLSSSNMLVDDILLCAEGSFSAANQRLKIVEDGINEDLDFDEIRQRVKSQKITTLEQEGSQILAEACQTLKTHYREQLKEIVYWSAFGMVWPKFDTLQASLWLQRPTRSLESLERKIRSRFGKVFSVQSNRVYINPKVDQYIRSIDSDSSSPSGPVGTSDDGKVSLSNAMDAHANTGQLQVSTIEGHCTIFERCLQALNEDDRTTREKTRSVLEYATQWMPEHIWTLRNDHLQQLSVNQRKLFAQDLIEFLSDEDCIDLTWAESPLSPSTWIEDSRNVVALGELLKDRDVQREMSPKNRRIAKRLTQQFPGQPALFLEPLAIRAGSHWLQRDLTPTNEGTNDDDQDLDRVNRCYSFVDSYLDLLLADPQTIAFKSTAESDDNTKTSDGSGPVEVTAVDETTANDDNVDPNAEKGPDRMSLPVSNEATERIIPESGHDDNSPHLEQTSVIQPPPVLSSKERVERAKCWVFQKLDLRDNYHVFTRMGQALLGLDNPAAIQHLLEASKLEVGVGFDKRYVRDRALATAHAHEKRFADAHAVLASIIDELRAQNKEAPLTAGDKKRFVALMKKAAQYLTSLEKDYEAIGYLKDCLGQVPDSSDCHQELVRLLCKNKQFAEAESAFDNWVISSEGNTAQAPAFFFTKAALDEEQIHMELFFWARGTSIHDRIMRILEDAIVDARKNRRARDACLLLLNHGFAHAIVGQEERLEQARDSWIQSIAYGLDTSVEDPYLCIESIWQVVHYEFNTAAKKLRAQPRASLDVRQAALKKLKATVESRLVPVQSIYSSVVYSPMVYVAVFARLAGLVDEAKVILKPDVEKALEVLSNSDVQDDELGTTPLIRVMLALGDAVRALSFWSFFDRASLHARRNTMGQKLTSDGDPTETSLKEQGETADGADGITAATTGADESKSSEDRYVTDFRFRGTCNSCGSRAWLDSLEGKEIWACTCCPNMDLCQECYEKIKANRNERVMCSSEHSHVLLKHFDYEEAEVEGQNVRIGWQLVESNDGRDRQRIGGEIVKLDDWVQLLRKEWDVPESKTEGRLQK